MKVGDEVLVIASNGDGHEPGNSDLIGCVGRIVEVYPFPFVFEFLVHFDAHQDNEDWAFNKEELEVI